jgi:hypothetical protein
MALAIFITIRSVLGYYQSRVYSSSDKLMANIFLALLYLTLINGAIMYFFINPSLKAPATDISQAIKRASLRFWVVEHFYVMTFALILSQIGRIFIRKTTNDKNRFAYASFYYGIATLITVISMTFYFIYK